MGYKNPVLDLPAARRLVQRPRREREDLAAVLRDLRHDANEQAETAWRRSKAPMAAYWKAVGTYARHLAHALLRGANQAAEAHPSDDMAPDTLDRYLARPNDCPYCGAVASLEAGQVDIDGPHAFQDVVCNNCNCSWTDEFQLVNATQVRYRREAS